MEELIFVCVLIFICVAIIWRFALWFHGFNRILKELKIEIQRTKDKEQKYWIRKKRRLWLSLLPFVRY